MLGCLYTVPNRMYSFCSSKVLTNPSLHMALGLSKCDEPKGWADQPSASDLQERPEAVLPTIGGQTALNLAKALAEVRFDSTSAPLQVKTLHTAQLQPVGIALATSYLRLPSPITPTPCVESP